MWETIVVMVLAGISIVLPLGLGLYFAFRRTPGKPSAQ